MLSNISWGNYVITVFVLVIIWYVFVIFRFYLPDVKAVLFGKKKFAFFKRKNGKNFDDPKGQATGSWAGLFLDADEKDSTIEEAEELCAKLSDAVKESKLRNRSKGEVFNLLKFIIQEYPFVGKSSLRSAINSFIVFECRTHLGLDLSDAELDALWDKSI